MNCPYCSIPITPTPKRGRPCPHCGEKFYVREGKLYTWAGAREHDKSKRRRYPRVSRICPQCGGIVEAGDFYFIGVNPCPLCRWYIRWQKDQVVQWDDVGPDKSWYNPYFPVPTRGGMEPVDGVMPFIEIKPGKNE